MRPHTKLHRANLTVLIAGIVALVAGAGISVVSGDLRPVLLSACFAWLGAEYIDHLAQQVRR